MQPGPGSCALRIVVRVGQDDFVVILESDVLKALHQLRKKGVGDVGNDQAEKTATPRSQRSRVGVGMIFEFPDSAPYTLRCLLAYGRGPLMMRKPWQ